jgi:hypothetical protein
MRLALFQPAIREKLVWNRVIAEPHPRIGLRPNLSQSTAKLLPKQRSRPMILAVLVAAAVFILIAGQHALETWNRR